MVNNELEIPIRESWVTVKFTNIQYDPVDISSENS